MPQRATRTTSEQQEIILNFLSIHRNMLSGKNHPLNVKEVDENWQELTSILNSSKGARKSTEDWKRFFIEWKNKTRKKARELKTNITGTGGGPSHLKQLTDHEERLMSLIGWVAVTGSNDLPDEIDPDVQPGPEPTNSETIITYEVLADENMELCEVENVCIADNRADNKKENISAKPATFTPVNSKKNIRRKKSATQSNVGALNQSAIIYANSAEKISAALYKFAIGIEKLAAAIEKFAEATEKLASANAATHII